MNRDNKMAMNELRASILNAEAERVKLAKNLASANAKITEQRATNSQLTEKATIKRLELAAHFRELHSQPNVSITLLPDGIAFACGQNKDGRLGVDDDANRGKLVQTTFGAVRSVDANYDTCTIDPNGQLWVNGVKRLRGKIVKFATSAQNIRGKVSYYAIDGESKIWSWGENDAGQLGNGTKTACTTPKMIESMKDVVVKQLAVYSNVVTAITTSNEAFVWSNCNAFGLGAQETPIKLENQRIQQISVGYDHALMINEANQVYSIGKNDFGQLGTGDLKNRLNWSKVHGFDKNETIKTVQCGDKCSAILTDCGVYVTGKWLCGSLDEAVKVPTKMELSKIVKISLTSIHILAMDKEGRVFAWGWNGYGRCGLDSSADQITKPTRLPISSTFAVVDISAGFNHSIIKCTK